MYERPLLPLLPDEDDRNTAKRGHNGSVEGSHALSKKRRSITVACNSCRSKKLGVRQIEVGHIVAVSQADLYQCDGLRPSCTRCKDKQVSCEYISINENETTVMARKRELNTLREELEEYRKVVETMRSGPEDAALLTFRALRSGRSVRDVQASMSSELNPSTTLPHQNPGDRILAESGASLESTLCEKYKAVYCYAPSLESNTIDLFSLDSIPSSSEQTPPDSDHAGALSSHGQEDGIDPSMLNRRLSVTQPEPPSVLCDTHEELDYCDARLARVDIRFWTKVPIENGLAAKAISFDLETEHAINGFFDAELFLNDLVDRRLEYCSTFFVSSLLCLACVSFQQLYNVSL